MVRKHGYSLYTNKNGIKEKKWNSGGIPIDSDTFIQCCDKSMYSTRRILIYHAKTDLLI